MEEPETLIILAARNDQSNDEDTQTSLDNSGWKHNYNLKVGDKDEDGDVIEDIHERVPGKYFIYTIADHDLRSFAEDETILSSNAKFNQLFYKIGDYLSNDPSLRKPFVSHLSFALKNLYDGYPDIACDGLTVTYDNMTRVMKRRAPLPYITGAFVLVLISLISYFLVYRFGNLNDFGYMMFSAVALSGLGGFLSVAISLRNINVDVQDHFMMKAAYGFIRIVIAMISGVIVYFLIEGKVALVFLKDLQNANTFYIAFFVSGFSEKLVSNLLFDFENKGAKTDSDK
jgi:hypothetical protein